MSQYEDDGTGELSCPECAAPQGAEHEHWCKNPEAPHNYGLTEDEIWERA